MDKMMRIFDLLNLYRDEYAGKQDVFASKNWGNWETVSAEDYLQSANRVSYGLMALGMKPGDKVATILGNRPEWNFIDMGILQAGCIHVPVYPTISAENHRFIFDDAGVKAIFIDNRETWSRLKGVMAYLPMIKYVFAFFDQKGLKHFSDLLKTGKKHENPEGLSEISSAISAGHLATIIYTSGTTGRPKGVMLSHNNLVSNFLAVSQILKPQQVERALSFLPLCHVYERMLNYMYQYLGISVYYAENLDRLRDNMVEVRPDMFCAVPRVIEKSYASILRKGRNLPYLKKAIFFWALNLGHRYNFKKAVMPVFALKLRIADRLVFRHWRKAFGGNLRIIVSGGAPLHPTPARVFWAAGIKVIEGYGLTETSPVVAVGTFEHEGVRFGTVGKALHGVNVKLADDGEILVKGPNVMMGYFNRPDKDAEVFDGEGWFHTGDIGTLYDGYLAITDRKKEIFKTSHGKYIAPQVIENRMKESPFIETVLVIGENRNYPSALIVPNFEYLKSWCDAKGIEYEDSNSIAGLEVVIARVGREIDTLNQTLDHTWQVCKFILMDKEWTMQSGELSPTLKVRRTYLQEKYAVLIGSMYGENLIEITKRQKKRKKKMKDKTSPPPAKL